MYLLYNLILYIFNIFNIKILLYNENYKFKKYI